MKHVRAIFQPPRLCDVVTALRTVPSIPLFTMTEVRGFPTVSDDRGPATRDSKRKKASR